jgi:deoxyadenosine/deoxycytidine kinase
MNFVKRLCTIFRQTYPIEIIYIDGNISGGKSSLMNNIAKYKKSNYNIVILKEPMNLWDNVIKDKDGTTLFKKYYNERSRYSFTFQHFVLMSKIAMLRDTINSLSRDIRNVIFIERSFKTDSEIFAKMCYENNFMTDLEYTIYKEWYKFVCNILDNYCDKKIIKQHYIYLETKASTCFDRLKKRNREGEECISLSYLETLNNKHTEMCERNLNIFVVDNDKDIVSNDDINKQMECWFKLIEYIIN